MRPISVAGWVMVMAAPVKFVLHGYRLFIFLQLEFFDRSDLLLILQESCERTGIMWMLDLNRQDSKARS
jgi:hypothetical protein